MEIKKEYDFLIDGITIALQKTFLWLSFMNFRQVPSAEKELYNLVSWSLLFEFFQCKENDNLLTKKC